MVTLTEFASRIPLFHQRHRDSREDASEAKAVSTALRSLRPTIRLFQDVDSLKIGGVWQQELYMALDASRKVLAILKLW